MLGILHILPLAVAAHASFAQIPSGNGWGTVQFDQTPCQGASATPACSRVSGLREHVFRYVDTGDETRSLLYDAYFGVRTSQDEAWLTTAPTDEAQLTGGIIKVRQRLAGLTATQWFFAPQGIAAPSLVMVIEVKNEGDQTINDVHVFSLHNLHLGGGTDGTQGQRADWDEAHAAYMHRAIDPGQRRVLVRSLTPPARHTVTPNNPYTAVVAKELFTNTDSSGDANDLASGFQYDVGSLAPGASATFGLVMAYQPFGTSATPLIDMTSSFIAGKSPTALVQAEQTAWDTWFKRARVPDGLTSDEKYLYLQQLAILRMAQSRESNNIQGAYLPSGQIVASLWPGKWDITWVRDSSYAIAALARAGLLDEARAGLEFMLRATADLYASYVGYSYRLSVCRYWGRGKEESDFNQNGPNIEFDGFGLYLWAAEQYLANGGSPDFLDYWWSTIAGGVADVLVDLVDSQNGLIAADSSIWEAHWDNGARKHFTYTQLWAVVGLELAAKWADGRDGVRAVAYRKAAARVRGAIQAQLVTGDDILRPSLEQLTLIDAATVEAFNQNVIDPQGKVAQATLGAFRDKLFLPTTGHGYKRNQNGDAYDEREWIMIDLRIATALRRLGQTEQAEALWSWVRDQGLANHGLLPELFDQTTADYAGETPMIGFGAGTFVLAAWDRANVVLPDGAAPVDAAASDGGTPPVKDGCSCALTSRGTTPTAGLWALCLALLALIGRRGRRGVAMLSLGLVLCGLALVTGCSGASSTQDGGISPQVRSCDTQFIYQSTTHITQVAIASEWNNFDPTKGVMSGPDQDGKFTRSETLPVGQYGYKLVVGAGTGQSWILDPSNPYTKWIGPEENSLVEVGDCRVPELRFVSLTQTPTSQGADVHVEVDYVDGALRAGADPAKITVSLDGHDPSAMTFTIATARLSIDASNLGKTKHRLVVRGADLAGRPAKDLQIPFWIEDRAFDFRDGMLYFTFTDRFRDGDPSINAPVPDVDWRANFQGGDFAGIKQAITDGYFDKLGVRTIWISPPNDSTDHGEWGSDPHLYSGYHGYWPTEGRLTQPRFGDLAALKDMVAAAHARGIRVIVDSVLNHVHLEHQYYIDRRGDNWFNPGDCLCGGCCDNNTCCGDCSWNVHRIDCWFTSYLPDIDYKDFAALERMIDDALYWAREADVDGFRVDAVKHFLEAATRRLRAKLHDEFEHVGPLFYLVGETFVGGDDSGRELMKQYIGPTMLNAQFDFSIYWHILGALGTYGESMRGLEAAALASDAAFGDAPMSPFFGNHDVARFISTANGDIWSDSKTQAWTAPPPSPGESWPYERQRLAIAFLSTQPGVPLIYYGDDIALPGTADPDNRRFMKWTGLSTEETATLEFARKAGAARGELPALQRGSRLTLWVDDDIYVYARVLESDVAIVAINRGGSRALSVPMRVEAPIADGTVLRDRLGGASVTVTGGKIELALGQRQAMILAP